MCLLKKQDVVEDRLYEEEKLFKVPQMKNYNAPALPVRSIGVEAVCIAATARRRLANGLTPSRVGTYIFYQGSIIA